MTDANTYKAKVYCSNCDFRNEIDIEKGKKVEVTACPNCGTLELRRDINVDLSQNYYDNGFGL